MLLDPFEKQLHLPAFPVKFRDRQGIKCRIVGYEFADNIGSKIFVKQPF